MSGVPAAIPACLALGRPVRVVTDEIAALEDLPEPGALRGHLRVVATDHPATARSQAPAQLAAYAADLWAPALAELGLGEADVEAAFVSAKREIWLWVEGERRWGQLASWLAGRVTRRAA